MSTSLFDEISSLSNSMDVGSQIRKTMTFICMKYGTFIVVGTYLYAPSPAAPYPFSVNAKQ